jgi:transposase InsO family protein
LVDELLGAVGPDLGSPTLRAFMPWVPRGSLERHLRCYRLAHRRRRKARLHQLRWKEPGFVWAIDLAHPPEAVEVGGREVLAVRDLSSRFTIAWVPLPTGSAESVASALFTFFRRHGAPLVLKSDNGSCFIAPRFRALLARFGIVHLRSPRAWPQYNGACEAGIGVLRALTDTAAAMRGQPDVWTIEDLEEARDRANDMMLRGRGPKAAPARESWRKRGRVTLRARQLFGIVLGRKLALLKKADPHAHRHRTRLRRKAIQQALVELGYLEIRTGWVRARSTGPGNAPTYR